MSTDFDAVCHRCRRAMHAGQYMAAIPSFGYGSCDRAGAAEVAAFVLEHASECGSVLIVGADDSPPGFRRVEIESADKTELPEATSEVVALVAAPVKAGAPVTFHGLRVGMALEDSVPDEARPGYHIVKMLIKSSAEFLHELKPGDVSTEET